MALREHGLQDLGVPAVAQAIVREVCPNGLILVDILGFEEVRQAHVNAGCLQRQAGQFQHLVDTLCRTVRFVLGSVPRRFCSYGSGSRFMARGMLHVD